MICVRRGGKFRGKFQIGCSVKVLMNLITVPRLLVRSQTVRTRRLRLKLRGRKKRKFVRRQNVSGGKNNGIVLFVSAPRRGER